MPIDADVLAMSLDEYINKKENATSEILQFRDSNGTFTTPKYRHYKHKHNDSVSKRRRKSNSKFSIQEKESKKYYKHIYKTKRFSTFPTLKMSIKKRRNCSRVRLTSKILIDNLDYDVTDDDLRNFFDHIGKIREAAIHYDNAGNSMGTAMVRFSRPQHALDALEHYHNELLYGRRIKIHLAMANMPSYLDNEYIRYEYVYETTAGRLSISPVTEEVADEMTAEFRRTNQISIHDIRDLNTSGEANEITDFERKTLDRSCVSSTDFDTVSICASLDISELIC